MVNSLKVAQSNWLPLSTVTSFGTPKRQTMFCQKNFCRAPAVMSLSALASTHLEKYSTATVAYLYFPGAVDNGPTISMPHRARGHTGAVAAPRRVGICCMGHA